MSKLFDVDLKTILEEHPIGKELLLLCGKKNVSLEAQWISVLCDIIVIHCLKHNITLTNEDTKELARKIVELFPAECVQTFYVPPVKKKDSLRNVSEISKGKLIDTYRNTLALIRTLRKVTNITEPIDGSHLVQNDSDNPGLASKNWLKHHRDELEVLLHWKLSYDLRRSEVTSNTYLSATDILNDWPILKESICSKLVC